MAVTWTTYHSFKTNAYNGKDIDIVNDSIIITLHTSSYTPSAATHDEKADLTNQLSTAAGYTQDAKALASKAWSLSSGTMTFDAADITWSASGGDIGPCRYAVLWDDTIAGDPLIGYLDFGADRTAGDGTDFKINWNASGIFTLA